MDVHAIWPFFACMALILLVAASPLCQAADAPPSPVAKRVTTLDGLRGFLALAVVFHHAVVYRHFMADGQWLYPASPFYDMLGPAGVSLFFMITGYLFWGRMIDQRGRPDWLQLYVGRVFRIGPVFLAAVAVAALAVFAEAGWHRAIGTWALLHQAATVMTLGLWKVPYINNNPDSGFLLAGATWTLHNEWLFYLTLPLTALATRRASTHLAFPALVLIGCLAALTGQVATPAFTNVTNRWTLFLVGMTCASLHRLGLAARLGRVGDAVVIVALVGTFALTRIFTPGSVMLLAVVFYLVASGGTVFGLLATRAAQRLGNISYGLYLLQGLALAAVMRPRWCRAALVHNIVWFWALALAAALLLVGLAMLAHVALERPGIALGRRVGRWLGRRLRRPAYAKAASVR